MSREPAPRRSRGEEAAGGRDGSPFDAVVRLTAERLAVPMAALLGSDGSCYWVEASRGISTAEAAMAAVFAEHVPGPGGVFVIADAALDQRFAAAPLVAGERGVRMIAAASIGVSPESGRSRGILFAFGPEARHLDDRALLTMRDFAELAGGMLESEAAAAPERGRSVPSDEWLRQLGTAIETMQVGVTMTDPGGRIIFCNRADAEMHGYRPEELIGKNAAIYGVPGSPGSAPPVEDSIRWRREATNRRSDGTLFPVDLTSDAVRDGHGRLLGYVTTCEDISERKLAEGNQRRLLERTLNAQDEERRRIARELHDETGQAMASILLKMRLIEEAEDVKEVRLATRELRRMLSQTMKGIAQLARGLHPSALDDLGLVAAIRRHTVEYGKVHQININFQTFDIENVTIPSAAQVALFRIVQEALTNIAKHSGATAIFVRLDRYEDSLGLAVVDDGRGFDPERTLQTYAKVNQLGLYGMRERIAALGGTMEVDSQPGRGTTLSVRLPLAKAS